MLKKFKTSVDEGGEMNSTDLYSLYQISNNAKNCGSSPPPPPHSDKPKGKSMFHNLKNKFTHKNKSGNPAVPAGTAGTVGPAGPSVFSKMKSGFNNMTRKKEKTPEQLEAAATKAAARAEKQSQKEAEKSAKAAARVAAAAAKAAAPKKTMKERFKTAATNTGAAISRGVANIRYAPVRAVNALKESTTRLTDSIATKMLASGQARAQATSSQVGGGDSSASHNRTRYISDIKNNRRRLYDREREIIQSIRNFENNNNNSNESRHHKTRKLRNILMRR